tara:strand:+ start:181 stop:837 length:657 start_codon:yes stop_codon:yes gene_type:complete
MTQLQRINERPTANFTFLENDISSVSDSVKFFSSLSKNNYNQDVTISDPEGNLKDVFFKISSGSGKVFSNGINTKRQLSINNSLGTDEIYSFNYRPEQLGYHEIQIFAQDELDEYDTLTIKLTVFENLSPVAALSVKPTRVVSRYEYTIDGSGSYDRDAKFGGEIVLYRFGINSQEIDLKKPKFPYVFGGEQIVNISLRVQDSNGQWSDPIEGLYSID